jgi:hypothetical protein
VQGARLRFEGMAVGFRVYDLGFSVKGSRFLEFWGLGCRVHLGATEQPPAQRSAGPAPP